MRRPPSPAAPPRPCGVRLPLQPPSGPVLGPATPSAATTRHDATAKPCAVHLRRQRRQHDLYPRAAVRPLNSPDD